MTEFILKVTIAFFSIVGVADGLHFLKNLILKPSHRIKYTVDIELFENQFEELNSILNEYKWSKTVKAEEIIISCSNISDEDFSECERLAKIYGVKILRK